MDSNDIKTFPKMKSKGQLSIEKLFIKCGKMLHKNFQAYVKGCLISNFILISSSKGTKEDFSTARQYIRTSFFKEIVFLPDKYEINFFSRKILTYSQILQNLFGLSWFFLKPHTQVLRSYLLHFNLIQNYQLISLANYTAEQHKARL